MLVGGFAASDYLFQKVDEAVKGLGLQLSRPHDHAYELSTFAR
jgi:hypothetical protein